MVTQKKSSGNRKEQRRKYNKETTGIGMTVVSLRVPESDGPKGVWADVRQRDAKIRRKLAQIELIARGKPIDLSIDEIYLNVDVDEGSLRSDGLWAVG